MVVYKEAYLKPRPSVEKTKFFFNYMDRLPPYQEVDGPVRSAPVHSIHDKQIELALLEARLFGLPDQKDPVHPEGCGSGLSPLTCLCGGPIGDRCLCGGH
jgi:hypothetical protein